jgi:hypothetical protein
MDPTLALIVGVGVGVLLTGLRSYATEKGKNLATKADIAEITRQVEGVRAEYIDRVERLKASLGETQTINRTQYELELTAYREVWQVLLPVHRAAAGLRPVLDFVPGPTETNDSRKKDRLEKFAETFNPFSEVVWKHRPFYPAAVFDELNELLRLMHSEALEYEIFDPTNTADYWPKAMASVKRIHEQVDKVCDTVRTRLSVARVA